MQRPAGSNWNYDIANFTSTDAAMSLFIQLLLSLAILPFTRRHDGLIILFFRHMASICEILQKHFDSPLTPATATALEQQFDIAGRSFNRDLLEFVYNLREDDEPARLPSHITVDREEYRLVKRPKKDTLKSPRRVHTLFGTILLRRCLYRPVSKDLGLPCQVPLERSLGLFFNATPALAEASSRYLAGAGATQQFVIAELKARHNVSIGVGQLRKMAGQFAASMAEARQNCQADRLLKLLDQAQRSKGRTRPLISFGRDGITLREHENAVFEVASAATVTVWDRSGKRLGSVFLGYAPESLQLNMTQQLTGLILEILRRWQGLMPRLAYITDAGDNESNFYEKVLRPMKHPVTGERVEWERVVDFYHTMERVWTMAWILFGADSPEGRAWAHRMRRLLKQTKGPFRVLRSAAALRHRRGVDPSRDKDFDLAYNFIRNRIKWMRYERCKRLRIPRGSGITEAACRTVFTQRLKLSGMRWSKAGAQMILDLRVVLLSGVWDEVFKRVIVINTKTSLPTQRRVAENSVQIAA
jgi:hypothetical protein